MANPNAYYVHFDNSNKFKLIKNKKMENIEFWQTFASAVVSFVFYIIGIFTNRKK